MTRKDYVTLAKAISATLQTLERTQEQLVVVDEVIYRLGIALKADNANFNPERFVSACLEGMK